MDIQNLWKQELVSLLKELNTYRDLTKKIWRRGRDIYKKRLNNKNDFIVEYSSNLDENFVLEKSLEVYKKNFFLNIDKNDIKLYKKDNLIWWIRVYMDDQMVDLSFLKIYNTLKK